MGSSSSFQNSLGRTTTMTSLIKDIIENLINEKVDRVEKESQSVLTADGKIVWVCGKRISDWAKKTKNTKKIAILSRHLISS